MSDIIQYEVHNSIRQSEPIQVRTNEPDYEKQRPLFAWLPTETIKKTYQLSTQYARLPMSTLLKKRYQYPNPALNFIIVVNLLQLIKSILILHRLKVVLLKPNSFMDVRL